MNANLEKQDQLPATIPELVDEINHDYPFANLKEKCIILKDKMMLYICGYKRKVDVKRMQRGRQNEPKARNKYRKEFKGNHKSTFYLQRVRASSLYPSLAVSPDEEVSCKCHVDSMYEAKCPWKQRNKTMKEYVAKADSFLVTDKSFLANIVKDILNKAFQFVGLGDMSAGKVEEVSSSKPFQLKYSHQYHTPVHHAMFASKKIHRLSYFSSQRDFLDVSGKEIILTRYFNINMPSEESSRKHLLTKGLKCMHFD